MTNVTGLLVDSLVSRGATGLTSSFGCGCSFPDLVHCEQPHSDCVAAYAVLCDGSIKCDYCVALDGEEIVCSVPCDWIDEAEVRK